MKARILAGLLSLLFAGAAIASTYSVFNAGIASSLRDDWDGTIAQLTAALAAPDLNPAFRAPAYYDRALAKADARRC